MFCSCMHNKQIAESALADMWQSLESMYRNLVGLTLYLGPNIKQHSTVRLR